MQSPTEQTYDPKLPDTGSLAGLDPTTFAAFLVVLAILCLAVGFILRRKTRP